MSEADADDVVRLNGIMRLGRDEGLTRQAQLTKRKKRRATTDLHIGKRERALFFIVHVFFSSIFFFTTSSLGTW